MMTADKVRSTLQFLDDAIFGLGTMIFFLEQKRDAALRDSDKRRHQDQIVDLTSKLAIMVARYDALDRLGERAALKPPTASTVTQMGDLLTQVREFNLNQATADAALRLANGIIKLAGEVKDTEIA